MPFTDTVEPASTVPETSIPPAFSDALIVLSPPSIDVIETDGGVVSTVRFSVAVLVLPAASVAVAVTTSGPSPAAGSVTDHVVPVTVAAVPFTDTVEPASTVPETTIPPAFSEALIVLSPPSIDVIATAGAAVSIA